MIGHDGGASSWSERWLAAVAPTEAGARRHFHRGADLARRGRVGELDVVAGRIRARVHQDRVRPYDVTLRVAVPDEAAWERAVAALARQLRHAASLLVGELPPDSDEVLAATGVRLLPGADEVTVACTCEARDACVHAAAVHHAVAAALGGDPLLLLQLRGRDRDQMLAALRSRRAGAAGVAVAGMPIPDGADLDAPRGDLDAIALHPAPADDPALLLRQLGPPPGVDDLAGIERLVARAAGTAWRIASGEGADAADEELLLAELRAQGTARAEAVAVALGRDVDEVRAALDQLFSSGAVLRTGHGGDARYRAAGR